MRLRQHLMALETKGGSHNPHVVLWCADQSFADALAGSAKQEGAASRLLIELSFVGDEPLTRDQIAEQFKAYAWADELEGV